MTNELNDNTDFNSIVDSIYSRRNFMKKGLYIGLSSFVMSSFHSSIYANAENSSKFDFVSVKANVYALHFDKCIRSVTFAIKCSFACAWSQTNVQLSISHSISVSAIIAAE